MGELATQGGGKIIPSVLCNSCGFGELQCSESVGKGGVKDKPAG